MSINIAKFNIKTSFFCKFGLCSFTRSAVVGVVERLLIALGKNDLCVFFLFVSQVARQVFVGNNIIYCKL